MSVHLPLSITPSSTLPEVGFVPMGVEHVEAVVSIEQGNYAHPWTRSAFLDVLHAGHQAQLLMAQDQLLGYFMAMLGVEEVHLLNIAVAPAFQRQGWAKTMLDALCLWSRGQGAHCVWLEVRASNLRAQQVYAACGFERMGVRKAYYPAARNQREDAFTMRLPLL